MRLNRSFACWLAQFACVFAARVGCAEIDVQKVVKQARPAVLLLVVEDEKGQSTSLGTGFFFSEDGKIVTNHHVAEGGGKIIAKAENGAFFEVERVLQTDPKADLAILQATAKHVPYLKLGRATEDDVGGSVVVVGSPLGLEGSVSTGVLSAVRNIGGVQKLQISAPISMGSSGSPVMNGDGSVIGVVSYFLVKGQNVNFAIAAPEIESLQSRPSLSGLETRGVVANSPSPEWSDPAFTEARRLLGGNDAASALKALNGLVARFPSSSTVRFYIGVAYMNLDFYQDAIEEFRKAIKIEPDDVRSWGNLTVCYCILNQYSLARTSSETAVKLNPTDAGVWRVRGLYLLYTKQFRSAIDALQQSIKFDPDDPRPLDLLATAYRASGLPQKAVEAQNRATAVRVATKGDELPCASPPKGSVRRIIAGVPAGDDLKVRTAPAMTSEVALTVYNGQNVQIRGGAVMNGKTEWVPITIGSTDGWVRSKYLKTESNESERPRP
jgi:Flp pilus assembly protein TadD